jgi:hypothetical protein
LLFQAALDQRVLTRLPVPPLQLTILFFLWFLAAVSSERLRPAQAEVELLSQ